MEKRLQPISLHQEMQRSYLEYAMSVIVGRALPDARDGLKPVQRRILYAMHELGLTPDRPFRKCARVVGDVLGKYHPHGDQAVYDALVRLVQTFASRYPVLDGHGNFGSVDDDPPAAMRYTETRLAPIAHQALLEEIGSNTVDFNPNFDGSQQEPSVLPAQLPFLILNGCSGIAVGMATSIPPHNINEIINALIEIIKRPNISEERLLTIIPGPDFPTGGEILLGNGIRDTYLKGKGSIPMRGICHVEEIVKGKGKHKKNAIIITELPYQVSKASWIEKLADLVNNGKIDGIADIRDESDRDGMRILIELRRDTKAQRIIDDLYQKTSLQSNFSATLLAIVNGQPKQLSLKELLNIFLEYRELTIIKRTKNELNKTNQRIEIVVGLIKALQNLRNVISMIESANDASEAKSKIMLKLNLNDKQADGILGMPLRKLTNLETQSLYKEDKDLKRKREVLENLINNRNELLKEIINELKNLKKLFGSKRRTKLIEGGDILIAERNANLRPNAELQRKKAFEQLSKDNKLIIQNNFEVKIISPKVLGKLHLEKSSYSEESITPIKLILSIEKQPKILSITNSGKIALLKWEFAGNQPGNINKFLPTVMQEESINQLIPLHENEKLSIGLITSDGRFKRVGIQEILEMSGRAASILKLKENIKVKASVLCHLSEYLIIVSDLGRILKIKIDEDLLPIMGKLAQGSVIMKLFPNENIIGAVCANNKEDIILVTNNGTLTKQKTKEIRNCIKGDLGVIAMVFKNKKEKVIQIFKSNQTITIITSKGKQTRVSKDDINQLNYNKSTLKNINLDKDEYLVDIIPLIDNNV